MHRVGEDDRVIKPGKVSFSLLMMSKAFSDLITQELSFGITNGEDIVNIFRVVIPQKPYHHGLLLKG